MKDVTNKLTSEKYSACNDNYDVMTWDNITTMSNDDKTSNNDNMLDK